MSQEFFHDFLNQIRSEFEMILAPDPISPGYQLLLTGIQSNVNRHHFTSRLITLWHFNSST